MRPRPVPRVTRGARSASFVLALAVAGCGSGHDEADPGFPPANIRTIHAAALFPELSGQLLRVPVPNGWRVARLGGSLSARRGLVRLSAPCYQSISITGSSIQTLSNAQVSARYKRAVQGYAWTVTAVGHRQIAVLDQYTADGSVPTRSTLGTAYLPLSARRRLAVDFGAGVWPLRRGSCPAHVVAGLVAPLRATLLQVFLQARIAAPSPDPDASPGGP